MKNDIEYSMPSSISNRGKITATIYRYKMSGASAANIKQG